MAAISTATAIPHNNAMSAMNQDRLDAAHGLLGVSPATVAGIYSMMPDSMQKQHFRYSNGLDALAALATASMPQPIIAPGCYSSSSDEEYESMPPPPPRRRMRAASNPEGMEKWDSLRHNRQHFVLPQSIIEEELAEAKACMELRDQDLERTSPDSLLDESDVEEKEMTQQELLNRARSRLLEDLSDASLNNEKGVLTLPHSLSKYKEVYNKNGRIGIYSPAERGAIIARFHSKRSRRVWNKKIRYNCRKNLADRRLRIKGRFVKRNLPTVDLTTEGMPDVNDPDAGFVPTDDQPFRRLRRHTIT